ncbi:hypothetical protein LAV45_06635 [Clostridium sporogenes]|nr:hypothetical protein [Clostridium sporogenes]
MKFTKRNGDERVLY